MGQELESAFCRPIIAVNVHSFIVLLLVLLSFFRKTLRIIKKYTVS